MSNLSLADRAVRFCNNLTLTDEYLGQPMVLRAWQEKFVRELHRTDDLGHYVYNTCLLLLPRKQAKTQVAGAIAGFHILGSGRVGQTAVVAASDRYQAGHLFRKVATFIEADPWLSKSCRIYYSIKRIETKSGNSLQVLSSDGRRAHGENPSLVIIDEVHTQKKRDLYDALTSSFGARKEHLTLLISTQGNRRDSLIFQESEYSRKVRDGVITNPRHLPVLYEAPVDADWTSEEVWRQAMPALDDFCNLEFIREEFAKAKEIPSEESKFRQLYLNQLVAASTKWLNSKKWELCGTTPVELDKLNGRKSYWGLDLSNTADITALVGVFPFPCGSFKVLPFFWIPKLYAELRAERDFLPYLDWIKRGYLNCTPGDVIDYPYIEEQIPILLKPYKVQVIHADPHNFASTSQRLLAAGLPIVPFRQGWKTMSPSIKHAEVTIAKGLLHHGNHPVLNWMGDNAVVHRDRQDNLTFDKPASADKIDGIVAMVMGLAGAIVDVKKPSVYSRLTADQLMGVEPPKTDQAS